MTDLVRLEVGEGVATVTLDRPPVNALNGPTLKALGDRLGEARDADPGALVLAGAPEEVFSAGADVGALVESDPAGADAYVEVAQRATRRLAEFPAPTVAAVDGYCLGGGWELALCCDLRVASERAVVGHTEIDLAVVPTWGGLRKLVRLVGDETARRLVYFGERVDGQDAYEMGLVGELVAHGEVDERVDTLAADLRRKPSFALHATKEAVDHAWTDDSGADRRYERRLWGELFGTDDQRRAMEAFLKE